jgi:uncharacterized protein YjbJ (UPF0337 family)
MPYSGAPKNPHVFDERSLLEMNRDVFRGKWMQLRGNIKKQWGEITDDELDQIEGDMDRMVGKLQEKYGYTRDEAERHLDDFLRDVDTH